MFPICQEVIMALPINVSDLINRRVIESARIEYKGDWNPEPILHSICAFANDIDNWGGGYIIIGIEEEDGMPKLPVKGLSKSSIDRINKELLQKCNLIESRYIPIVEQVSYEGKEIIVLCSLISEFLYAVKSDLYERSLT